MAQATEIMESMRRAAGGDQGDPECARWSGWLSDQLAEHGVPELADRLGVGAAEILLLSGQLATTTCDAATAYDAVADRYDRLRDPEEDDAVWSLLATCWGGEIQRARRVIDVGCGTGWLLDRVARWSDRPDDLRERYLGIDVAPRMLRRAIGKHPAHCFEVYDVRRLDLMCGAGSGHVVDPWSVAGVKQGSVVSTFGALNYVPPAYVHRLLRHASSAFVQLWTPGYTERPSYVLRGRGVRTYAWTAAQLHELAVPGVSVIEGPAPWLFAVKR